MASGPEITATDLRLPVTAVSHDNLDFGPLLELPFSEAKEKLIESFERTMITAALSQHDGNVSAAARQLGIHRQSLQQKMAQLGISRIDPSQ
jgi:DNA-binding NtrC family response regulator